MNINWLCRLKDKLDKFTGRQYMPMGYHFPGLVWYYTNISIKYWPSNFKHKGKTDTFLKIGLNKHSHQNKKAEPI
jgi:hypothetical protein